MFKQFALGLAMMAALATPSFAQDIVRHTTPGSNFPIARAVEVPAGKTTVYVSGAVPRVIDKNADRATPAAYGDMEAQTTSVLESISATLADLDLTMGDVVKMQAFLVAPDGQSVDFEGFMKGYTRFFGTPEQGNLPARSVVIVAGLVNPGWLVEIEVTAVRP